MTRREALALVAAMPVRGESIRIINPERQFYCGWPTLARRKNGDLLVVWSGGRESHVCPFGRVELMVSRDEGNSWSWPRVLMDTDIDDRDAGIVETQRGSLLVTTFTSLAYEPLLSKTAGWESERLTRWEAIQKRMTPTQRKGMLGCWMLRSTDGGMTWSAPYRVPLNSPHGPVPVSDGRILYAGKDLCGGGDVGICESTDDGANWRWLAKIAPRPGDRTADYHELHMVEAAPRHLIVHIRNHSAVGNRETLQSESLDGDRTWSVPREIGVWGLPSHLLRLRDGRLLMSYGYRREPFGNQARVSSDRGRTWSEPITLSSDGHSGDLGYPSTVQLAGGELLSVWYEKLRDTPFAVLRQLRWKLS